MTFKAFRGSAFNHSHENKAFNDLHDLLQQHWSEQDEPLYLIGNFFVGGKELDALVVKRNAIIVIDFKNYGGEVKFSENNRWTCDGVPVKGGNSINPYQQLRANKFTLLEYIKSDRISLKSDPNLGHIAALTLFQQPIQFDEQQVPAKIRSWFHVGDMLHAVRTIDSIASASIDLPNADLETLINTFDVPPYFPDGRPQTRIITATVESELPTIRWTEGQQRVLSETTKWLEEDATALIVTGMVSTGKRTVLAEVIQQVEQHGLTPVLLTPNGRIAQRYQLRGFDECHSVYTYLYSSQPDRIEKSSSGVGVGVHEVKLTPQDAEGKCLIFVEAHLLGNSFFATDTTRFGTGHLVNDLLEAVGQTLPKMVLVGDPYQLSRGDLKLSFIHSHVLEERDLKTVRVVVDEQLRPDPEQQGLLDFQFDLAEHLKHKHYNRLPKLDGDQVSEVGKDPNLPNELSTGYFYAVYLCALNEAAHRINLAVKKSLRPQGVHSLEVGDRVDFHNRTHVVIDDYDSPEINGQESSNVNAGDIGIVEWVSDQEEVHSILLKGREKPTDLRFGLMRCKVPGLGSVNVRYLPNYLIAEKPELSSDQLIAMNIFARQQAERDLSDLKDKLSRLKESEDEADKSRYKAEKERFDLLVNRRVMSSGYFNAARIRFAYAMTVHRGQGREWSHVILNAERSSGGESHHNDEYFRYLYTATTCASAKLSLQKYPDLNPLSQCIFKANSQCKIGPFNLARPFHYDRDRKPNDSESRLPPPRGLTDPRPQLIALLLTIIDRLGSTGWKIECISQHTYQEHYTFMNANDQNVVARMSYKGDFSLSNITWITEDVDQVELRKLQDCIYGGNSFDSWEVQESVQALDDLLLPAGYSRVSVKESAYRAQVGFIHSLGTIELEVNVGKTGLASSVRPVRASEESLIATVQELIESV
jgi:hypothetical protein